MESANVVELRRHSRFSPDDLFAVVDEEIVHVENISAAGICIRRPAKEFAQKKVLFWIAPVAHEFLDMSRAVQIDGHIVGSSDDKVRIVFSSVSYELSNIINRTKAAREL